MLMYGLTRRGNGGPYRALSIKAGPIERRAPISQNEELSKVGYAST